MCNKSGILEFSRQNDIAVITINNPPRNRLPDPVFTNPAVLHSHLSEVGLRGAVIVGAGKNFCEGAAIDSNVPEDIHKRITEGKRILDIIEESPVPVIAAINGACFGAGLEIALACHIRVVGTSALLGFPEADLGIMPGLAGTLRSIEEVDYRNALPLLLSSEYVSGEQAVGLNLAHYAVPRQQVLDKAFEVLTHILGNKRSKVINYIMKATLAAKREDRKLALDLESRLVVELVEEQYKKKDTAQLL